MSNLGVDEIFPNGCMQAVIVSSHFQDDKLKFLTPQEAILQLGYMKHPSGYSIAPHIHNKVRREIYGTQEVLFIKSGKVKVTLYSEEKIETSQHVLNTGDFIIFLEGGHGIQVIEEAEIVEVKNGPYAGYADKTRF